MSSFFLFLMLCFLKFLELKSLFPFPLFIVQPWKLVSLMNYLLYFFSFPKVQDLHTKLSLESKRADTLAFEMKRLEEKHEALLKEKEVIINVR